MPRKLGLSLLFLLGWAWAAEKPAFSPPFPEARPLSAPEKRYYRKLFDALAMPAKIREHALALTPARRLGTPEEVARLVAFLCSDGAGFINGAEIDIDGGLRLSSAVLGSQLELDAR